MLKRLIQLLNGRAGKGTFSYDTLVEVLHIDGFLIHDKKGVVDDATLLGYMRLLEKGLFVSKNLGEGSYQVPQRISPNISIKALRFWVKKSKKIKAFDIDFRHSHPQIFEALVSKNPTVAELLYDLAVLRWINTQDVKDIRIDQISGSETTTFSVRSEGDLRTFGPGEHDETLAKAVNYAIKEYNKS